ncbi:MAG: tail fiber domain-containing protein [Terriglobia bacterium]
MGAISLRAQSGSGSAGVVPRLIKFSGEVNPQITQITQTKENENGKSQSPAVVALSFSLYELQEAGSPLWSESQKVQLDEQGRYTVLLGATQPEGLPLDLFTSGRALWLGVQPQLPGATEQPRVLLVAVPYALKAADADTLGGFPASAFLAATASQLGGTSSQSGSAGIVNGQRTTDNGPPTSAPQPGAPCPSVTSDGTATANSIAMFTTNCNLEASAITQTSGNIGISGASPANTKFQITDTAPPDSGIHYTNHELLNTSVTKNGTNKGLTFVMDASNMTIPAGVTDSGYRVGVEGAAYANTAAFAGTLATQYGVWGRAGIFGATVGAKVSNAYAGYFDIFNSVAGTTITNAYGVYINNSATTGTITNRYDLYAASANAKSYFAGNVGIGTTTPAAKLEVNGTTKFDMPVAFAAAQTFAGNGAGLTNVNAATLDGTSPGNFIQNGTSPQAGANFNIAGSGALGGILSLPATTTVSVGVIDLGGSPFIHACCPESTENTFVGTNAGTYLGGFTANASTHGGVGANTAVGDNALSHVTSGYWNTAIGDDALVSTSTGIANTAIGYAALSQNFAGIGNTAVGLSALLINETGQGNTAIGEGALSGSTAGDNVAVGAAAGQNLKTGSSNIIVGTSAGTRFFSNESNNIDIGNYGVSGESGVVRIGTSGTQARAFIAGITGVTPKGASPLPVVIDSNGQLGTGTSAVGTVTSVASGAGLTGGPITTSGTLSLASASCGAGQAAVALPLACSPFATLGRNTFAGTQTISNGNLWFSSGNGGNNVGLGTQALFANTTGQFDTATGYQALFDNTTGGANTASGSNALQENTTGSWNVAMGYWSLSSNTTGNNNTASGLAALYYNTTGSGNTAVGASAGDFYGSPPFPTKGSNSTFLGAGATATVDGLTNATAIGANSQVGESNALVLGNGAMVGIGTSTPQYALDVQGTGNFAGAVTVTGLTAGNCLQAGTGGLLTTTASPCGSGGGGTITGVTAGTDLTGGGTSGVVTLNVDTTKVPQLGTPNTFAATQTVGSGDLSVSNGNLDLPGTTGAAAGVINLGGLPFIQDCCFDTFQGYTNMFIGVLAGNFTTTGVYNTASGTNALYSNTSGSNNTASGTSALYSNTAGSYNTASGSGALGANTTGNYNTASGFTALALNTAGFDNTANGYQALYSNTTPINPTDSSYNTASGFWALHSNTTGSANTASGWGALDTNITGGYNTATGVSALQLNSTGSYNTASGNGALAGNTTGSFNTAVGYGADVASGNLTSATAIGACALVRASNALVLGAYGAGECVGITANTKVGIDVESPSNIFTVLQGGGHAIADGWDTYSSRRWKSDIQSLHGALGKVERLRGVSYTYTANGKHDIGMIAEEVGRVVPEVVSYEENGKDARGIDYARLTALLVEAVKQQQAEIRQLQAEVGRLKRAQARPARHVAQKPKPRPATRVAF